MLLSWIGLDWIDGWIGLVWKFRVAVQLSVARAAATWSGLWPSPLTTITTITTITTYHVPD